MTGCLGGLVIRNEMHSVWRLLMHRVTGAVQNRIVPSTMDPPLFVLIEVGYSVPGEGSEDGWQSCSQ